MYGESVHNKLYELAVYTGIAHKSDSFDVASDKFISAIEQLNKKIGIPERITGIEKADIPKMAVHADKEGNPLYPVPRLMDKTELEKIYYAIADWS